MLISVLAVIAIAAGGTAITYLLSDDDSFLWRISAGNVLGSALFGTVCFLLSCLLGLNIATVALTGALTLVPLLLLSREPFQTSLRRDWQKANGKFHGANFRKVLRFAYYLSFIILFCLFFDRAMFETREGIFTGSSHNLGDLPFHLGSIFSFTEANNLPPENPSFAGAKFSYPFIADLITASFMKLGADVKSAMFVPNVAWAFSLLVLLERFVLGLTNEKLAARVAPLLLFFSGGLGFLWFFQDYWAQGSSINNFLWKLPGDYTKNEDFAWANSLTALFLTQRSILLGMPLTVVVLDRLWSVFVSKVGDRSFLISAITVGLFAGMLPLIHLHSLIVLFVVTGFLFLFRPDKWRWWLAFGGAVTAVAVPELLWSLTGSASAASEFTGWHFGWESGGRNVLYFWLLNTGIVIPMIMLGGYLAYAKWTDKNTAGDTERSRCADLLLFYVPFLFCFIVSNAMKLAPWPWDNIKVLIYWYLGSLPLIGIALARLWKVGAAARLATAVAVLVLTLSGALDVWRVASRQISTQVFDADSVKLANQIRERVEPQALFLNAPTYNSPVVLAGRQSLMRYTGHLWSHGINYSTREAEVKSIYAGGAAADGLMDQLGIEYVLVSPQEKGTLTVNEQYFQRYPVVAESGRYRVYRVKSN